ncbi:hypothetical protein [Streptomyces graminilatus]|uniref:hypothetical protein n=1 Tax=Streptomyces graminilatus TaxID=1464070 RepID=UPI0006E25057|nr:hypothetical protein [Streptomyces graminilatus]
MPRYLPPDTTTAEQPARPPADRPQRGDEANGSSHSSSQDVCPLRDWGCLTALRHPSWQLLSSHSTSEGDIEYCRCTCDALVVLRKGELTAFTGPRLG